MKLEVGLLEEGKQTLFSILWGESQIIQHWKRWTLQVWPGRIETPSRKQLEDHWGLRQSSWMPWGQQTPQLLLGDMALQIQNQLQGGQVPGEGGQQERSLCLYWRNSQIFHLWAIYQRGFLSGIATQCDLLQRKLCQALSSFSSVLRDPYILYWK